MEVNAGQNATFQCIATGRDTSNNKLWLQVQLYTCTFMQMQIASLVVCIEWSWVIIMESWVLEHDLIFTKHKTSVSLYQLVNKAVSSCWMEVFSKFNLPHFKGVQQIVLEKNILKRWLSLYVCSGFIYILMLIYECCPSQIQNAKNKSKMLIRICITLI